MAEQIALEVEPFEPVDLEGRLERVRSNSGTGLYASGDIRFRDAIFGRDMAEAALDLLGSSTVESTQQIARDVILTLTKLLGTRDAEPGRDSNEERFGKVHHEHRSVVIEGRHVSPYSAERCRRMAALWGGTDTSVTYYGSLDATPQYVRLVAKFCARYGDSLLDSVVVNKDDEQLTVRDGVRRALTFLLTELESSELGLLEYVRENPRGLYHRSWTETPLAYLLPEGKLANHFQPIASIEIQGLAYDALRQGEGLIDKDLSSRLRAAAIKLQEVTLERLWMEDRQYFAMAIDRDPFTGKLRRIDAISSKPGALLDTEIFDNLSNAERKQYIGGIVRTVYSPQLLTPVGVRCRSVEHVRLHDLVDYHGVRISWPKETNDIARGLWLQGFARLGAQLDIRLLNGINTGGGAWECFVVDVDGKVDYDPRKRRPTRSGVQPTEIKFAITPEEPQTWTVTAALEAASRLKDGIAPRVSAQTWQEEFEISMFSSLPPVGLASSSDDLARYYEETGKDFIPSPTSAWDDEKTLMEGLYRRSFLNQSYEPDPVAEALNGILDMR